MLYYLFFFANYSTVSMMTTELKNKIKSYFILTEEDESTLLDISDNKIITDFAIKLSDLEYIKNLVKCKNIDISTTEGNNLVLTIFK